MILMNLRLQRVGVNVFIPHCQVNFIRFSGREKMKTVIKRQILNRPPLTYTYLPQRYQQYSLLNLYSVFFLLLVPYSENLLLVPCSENLLLDRVASNSKKAHIFQNIQFVDTDIEVFWFISFSWSRIFASLLFVSTWQAVVFIFCENANISDRPRPPC